MAFSSLTLSLELPLPSWGKGQAKFYSPLTGTYLSKKKKKKSQNVLTDSHLTSGKSQVELKCVSCLLANRLKGQYAQPRSLNCNLADVTCAPKKYKPTCNRHLGLTSQ